MEFLERAYPEDRDTILNAINDMIELQKGTILQSDTPHGKITYEVSLYDVPYVFRFHVTAAGTGCAARIETQGGYGDLEKRLEQIAHLLDSMLI